MEIVSIILNLLLGGGFIVTIVTLKSQRRKANAEARNKELENEEKSAEILLTHIVEPLKKEINALRKEIRKLSNAVSKTKNCKFVDDCPVVGELQNHPDDSRE